jgi:hypothetical protein
MEWTTIDYEGMMIQARDFLNGVLVKVPMDEGWQIVGWPGYRVQEKRGDMEGPRLIPRKSKAQVFNLLAVEQKE